MLCTSALFPIPLVSNASIHSCQRLTSCQVYTGEIAAGFENLQHQQC